MTMLSILIALGAGILGGVMAGGFMGWWIVRRLVRPLLLEHIMVDDGLDHTINRAASQWAIAHGRPEAAHLVADKLRLLSRLSERHRRRHVRRGWFV
jgi:hypothetical protein